VKHLFDDSRTRDLLKEWAQTSLPGPAPLCLTTFFFWNSGSTEQKSQAGLLQSIISQIFEQYPELIPIILPLRWAKAYSRLLKLDSGYTKDEDLWSLKQLIRAFTSILRQEEIPLKLCFFIDRFEKFEGDQEDLSQMVKDFATAERSGIKICFSSRTWPIFKTMFPRTSYIEASESDLQRH
jgi:hypothetical protein